MKRVYLLTLCILATAMLYGCKSNQEQLHDEFVSVYVDEEMNDNDLTITELEGEIEILEYILAIKDDNEFAKAIEYIWEYDEARMEWLDELEIFEDEEFRDAYNLEEQADTFEEQVYRRADRLDL
ncbi:MAG: hypothetical protein J6V59_03355 [Alistipes sp.]|nr:hypothetical protein [Alistipes sp.]